MTDGMRVPSSDGVVVTVHDLGGTGEPFLICHATGFLGRIYEPMAAPLTTRHHVYALDFRGHGDTPPPANENFDWGGMADDLEAVIPELTDEPLAVFGHSMGGAVAMLVEERRPGTLRSAYLYEPIIVPATVTPGFTEGDNNSMAMNARKRRPSFPSKADALYRYASRPPLNGLQASALYAYVEHGFREEKDGTAWLKCRPEDESATFAATGKATVENVANVQTPTVVAVGVDDGSWSPSMFGPGIVEAMPHAVLERHPKLGHFGPLQDPSAIAEAILAREG
ncbi:MAG TPA: alpha/beta hydrolase [Acidimicrobiales bacterium]|nr:alpha/beta hydrolase [Acidimicrobiales bacterium]